MPMYNLLEYGSNDSDTTSRLWFYSKDEAANFNNDICIVIIIILNLLSLSLNY